MLSSFRHARGRGRWHCCCSYRHRARPGTGYSARHCPAAPRAALPAAGPLSTPPQIPDLTKRENFSAALQIVILMTVLSLAPAILIMMTSFTRIIIVLSLLRQALGTQQLPPEPGAHRPLAVHDVPGDAAHVDARERRGAAALHGRQDRSAGGPGGGAGPACASS